MSFKVGDLVEGVGFPLTTRLNGMQGVIVVIGPYEAHDMALNKFFMADYRVEWADGDVSWVLARNLRKRRPPEQPADDQEFINWCNSLGRDTEKVMRSALENLQAYTGECGK